MAGRKVDKEPNEDDLEELRHLSFHDIEGERGIKDGIITDTPQFLIVKLWKHNIRIDEKPKLVSIGDYWDEQTTKHIFDLLREYENLFSFPIMKLKWIKGHLEEMKIILKLDAKLVKHHPYRLNPRVKEKVKKDIDKVLESELIFLVDEAELVSLIVIQNKKYATQIRIS